MGKGKRGSEKIESYREIKVLGEENTQRNKREERRKKGTNKHTERVRKEREAHINRRREQLIILTEK